MVSKKFVCVHEICLSFHQVLNLFELDYQKIICSMSLHERAVISFVVKMHNFSSFDGLLMNLVILVFFLNQMQLQNLLRMRGSNHCPHREYYLYYYYYLQGWAHEPLYPHGGNNELLNVDNEYLFCPREAGRDGWIGLR